MIRTLIIVLEHAHTGARVAQLEMRELPVLGDVLAPRDVSGEWRVVRRHYEQEPANVTIGLGSWTLRVEPVVNVW